MDKVNSVDRPIKARLPLVAVEYPLPSAGSLPIESMLARLIIAKHVLTITPVRHSRVIGEGDRVVPSFAWESRCLCP